MLIRKPGDTLGKWRLEEIIGEGGNAIVWRACSKDHKYAALKLLSPWTDESGQAYYDRKRYARFRDEVSAFEACQDLPGVLRLLDSHTPISEEPSVADPPWIALALATPMLDELDDNYTLRDAVHAIYVFSVTLSAMHRRGYSHRDIKPDNLFSHEGNWKLGDFGLVDFPGKTAKTSHSERLGPRFYIADEMLNDPVNSDGRIADVFSLAKTLWKLGTRQAYPLQGAIRSDTRSMRMSTYSDDTRAYLLDRLLENATQHDPTNRLRMPQFQSELGAWLSPQSQSVVEDGVLNIDGLRHRIDAVHGDFPERQTELRENNNQVEKRVSAFLNAFANQLQSLAKKLNDASVSCSVTLPQQGRHHVWLAARGQEMEKDAYFSQIDLTAYLKKPLTKVRATIIGGVCVRYEVEKTRLGQRYDSVGPYHAVAAFSVNISDDLLQQECVRSDCAEFLLGGPLEQEVIRRFQVVLDNGFAPTVERALSLVETSS